MMDSVSLLTTSKKDTYFLKKLVYFVYFYTSSKCIFVVSAQKELCLILSQHLQTDKDCTAANTVLWSRKREIL